MQLFLIAFELKIQQEKLVKNLSPIKRLDVSKSGPGVYIESQIDRCNYQNSFCINLRSKRSCQLA